MYLYVFFYFVNFDPCIELLCFVWQLYCSLLTHNGFFNLYNTVKQAHLNET